MKIVIFEVIEMKKKNFIATTFLIVSMISFLVLTIINYNKLNAKVDVSSIYCIDENYDYNFEQELSINNYYKKIVKKDYFYLNAFEQNTKCYFKDEVLKVEYTESYVKVRDLVKSGESFGYYNETELISTINFVVLSKDDEFITIRNLDTLYADVYLQYSDFFKYNIGEEFDVLINGECVTTANVFSFDYVNLYDDKLKMTLKIDNSSPVFLIDSEIIIYSNKNCDIDEFYYIESNGILKEIAESGFVKKGYTIIDSELVEINVIFNGYIGEFYIIDSIYINSVEIEKYEDFVFFINNEV